MTPTEQLLTQRISELEALVYHFIKTDRFVFDKNFQFQEGRNIQVGTTTGTTFGTSVTQKIGFYGKTPVAQQTAAQPYTAADIGGILKNLGLLTT